MDDATGNEKAALVPAAEHVHVPQSDAGATASPHAHYDTVEHVHVPQSDAGATAPPHAHHYETVATAQQSDANAGPMTGFDHRGSMGLYQNRSQPPFSQQHGYYVPQPPAYNHFNSQLPTLTPGYLPQYNAVSANWRYNHTTQRNELVSRGPSLNDAKDKGGWDPLADNHLNNTEVNWQREQVVELRRIFLVLNKAYNIGVFVTMLFMISLGTLLIIPSSASISIINGDTPDARSLVETELSFTLVISVAFIFGCLYVWFISFVPKGRGVVASMAAWDVPRHKKFQTSTESAVWVAPSQYTALEMREDLAPSSPHESSAANGSTATEQANHESRSQVYEDSRSK